MQTYNGFSNYTTQRVAEDLAIRGIDLIHFGGGDIGFDPMMVDEYELADAIRKTVDELLRVNAGDTDGGLAVYYARLFVADCNWLELAMMMIDNEIEEEKKQDEYFERSGR